MEAKCSSEISVDCQRTTRHYTTLLNHPCDNLKSHIFFSLSREKTADGKGCVKPHVRLLEEIRVIFSPLCYGRKKLVSPSLLGDSNSRGIASSVLNSRPSIRTRLELYVAELVRVTVLLRSKITNMERNICLSTDIQTRTLSLSLFLTHTHTHTHTFTCLNA
jgi:hypothetical protein